MVSQLVQQVTQPLVILIDRSSMEKSLKTALINQPYLHHPECRLKKYETPGKASRPFDESRLGFILSEGSGVVILEEHAKSRGA